MNKFVFGVTDTVYIHSGRFHADDMMFAALASIVIQKSGKTPNIIRVNNVETVRGKNVIIGDIGRGVYDHHMEEGNISYGALNNTENYMAAACGLLYADISQYLFKGPQTETKSLFEALLNIIEHCDNSSDVNTFSDTINLLTPADSDKLDEYAMAAIRYCKDIINGFVDNHNKEKVGKIWAIPKIGKNVYPGIREKIDERYRKISSSTRARYKYISYNGKSDMFLKSMETYSLAMSALHYEKRKKWRNYIEQIDAENVKIIQQREDEEWPIALQNMKHRVIYVSNYIPWAKHVKDINAIFVVQESQRGGYSVTPIKTIFGTYRCSPTIITNASGRTYVANDSRFLLFDTKEDAMMAAEMAGSEIDKLLEVQGIKGYRKVYGGLDAIPEGQEPREMLSEDITLRAFVRDKVKNLDNMTNDEYNMLIDAAQDSQNMIQSLKAHIKINTDCVITWDDKASIFPKEPNSTSTVKS